MLEHILENHNYKNELSVALQAAQKAGDYSLKYVGKVQKIEDKGAFSLVSEVDTACEDIILNIISKSFPNSFFLSEESGEHGSEQNEYKWIIDPIDGTDNYIRGIPMYGISIALEHNKELALGVILFPVLKEQYVAIRSKGAYKNNEQISVSKNSPNYALVVFGSSILRSHEDYFLRVKKTNPTIKKLRMYGASTINMVYVASGRCEAYIDDDFRSWDVAASSLILQEAGGRITKINGQAWNHYDRELVASNGIFHDKLVKALNS